MDTVRASRRQWSTGSPIVAGPEFEVETSGGSRGQPPIVPDRPVRIARRNRPPITPEAIRIGENGVRPGRRTSRRVDRAGWTDDPAGRRSFVFRVPRDRPASQQASSASVAHSDHQPLSLVDHPIEGESRAWRGSHTSPGRDLAADLLHLLVTDLGEPVDSVEHLAQGADLDVISGRAPAWMVWPASTLKRGQAAGRWAEYLWSRRHRGFPSSKLLHSLVCCRRLHHRHRPGVVHRGSRESVRAVPNVQGSRRICAGTGPTPSVSAF